MNYLEAGMKRALSRVYASSDGRVVAIEMYSESARRWRWTFLRVREYVQVDFEGALPNEIENRFCVAAYELGISDNEAEAIRRQESWLDCDKTRTWVGYVLDRCRCITPVEF